jgi:hypothetical protein
MVVMVCKIPLWSVVIDEHQEDASLEASWGQSICQQAVVRTDACCCLGTAVPPQHGYRWSVVGRVLVLMKYLQQFECRGLLVLPQFECRGLLVWRGWRGRHCGDFKMELV